MGANITTSVEATKPTSALAYLDSTPPEAAYQQLSLATIAAAKRYVVHYTTIWKAKSPYYAAVKERKVPEAQRERDPEFVSARNALRRLQAFQKGGNRLTLDQAIIFARDPAAAPADAHVKWTAVSEMMLVEGRKTVAIAGGIRPTGTDAQHGVGVVHAGGAAFERIDHEQTGPVDVSVMDVALLALRAHSNFADAWQALARGMIAIGASRAVVDDVIYSVVDCFETAVELVPSYWPAYQAFGSFVKRRPPVNHRHQLELRALALNLRNIDLWRHVMQSALPRTELVRERGRLVPRFAVLRHNEMVLVSLGRRPVYTNPNATTDDVKPRSADPVAYCLTRYDVLVYALANIRAQRDPAKRAAMTSREALLLAEIAVELVGATTLLHHDELCDVYDTVQVTPACNTYVSAQQRRRDALLAKRPKRGGSDGARLSAAEEQRLQQEARRKADSELTELGEEQTDYDYLSTRALHASGADNVDAALGTGPATPSDASDARLLDLAIRRNCLYYTSGAVVQLSRQDCLLWACALDPVHQLPRDDLWRSLAGMLEQTVRQRHADGGTDRDAHECCVVGLPRTLIPQLDALPPEAAFPDVQDCRFWSTRHLLPYPAEAMATYLALHDDGNDGDVESGSGSDAAAAPSVDDDATQKQAHTPTVSQQHPRVPLLPHDDVAWALNLLREYILPRVPASAEAWHALADEVVWVQDEASSPPLEHGAGAAIDLKAAARAQAAGADIAATTGAVTGDEMAELDEALLVLSTDAVDPKDAARQRIKAQREREQRARQAAPTHTRRNRHEEQRDQFRAKLATMSVEQRRVLAKQYHTVAVLGKAMAPEDCYLAALRLLRPASGTAVATATDPQFEPYALRQQQRQWFVVWLKLSLLLRGKDRLIVDAVFGYVDELRCVREALAADGTHASVWMRLAELAPRPRRVPPDARAAERFVQPDVDVSLLQADTARTLLHETRGVYILAAAVRETIRSDAMPSDAARHATSPCGLFARPHVYTTADDHGLWRRLGHDFDDAFGDDPRARVQVMPAPAAPLSRSDCYLRSFPTAAMRRRALVWLVREFFASHDGLDRAGLQAQPLQDRVADLMELARGTLQLDAAVKITQQQARHGGDLLSRRSSLGAMSSDSSDAGLSVDGLEAYDQRFGSVAAYAAAADIAALALLSGVDAVAAPEDSRVVAVLRSMLVRAKTMFPAPAMAAEAATAFMVAADALALATARPAVRIAGSISIPLSDTAMYVSDPDAVWSASQLAGLCLAVRAVAGPRQTEWLPWGSGCDPWRIADWPPHRSSALGRMWWLAAALFEHCGQRLRLADRLPGEVVTQPARREATPPPPHHRQAGPGTPSAPPHRAVDKAPAGTASATSAIACCLNAVRYDSAPTPQRWYLFASALCTSSHALPHGCAAYRDMHFVNASTALAAAIIDAGYAPLTDAEVAEYLSLALVLWAHEACNGIPAAAELSIASVEVASRLARRFEPDVLLDVPDAPDDGDDGAAGGDAMRTTGLGAALEVERVVGWLSQLDGDALASVAVLPARLAFAELAVHGFRPASDGEGTATPCAVGGTVVLPDDDAADIVETFAAVADDAAAASESAVAVAEKCVNAARLALLAGRHKTAVTYAVRAVDAVGAPEWVATVGWAVLAMAMAGPLRLPRADRVVARRDATIEALRRGSSGVPALWLDAAERVATDAAALRVSESPDDPTPLSRRELLRRALVGGLPPSKAAAAWREFGRCLAPGEHVAPPAAMQPGIDGAQDAPARVDRMACYMYAVQVCHADAEAWAELATDAAITGRTVTVQQTQHTPTACAIAAAFNGPRCGAAWRAVAIVLLCGRDGTSEVRIKGRRYSAIAALETALGLDPNDAWGWALAAAAVSEADAARGGDASSALTPAGMAPHRAVDCAWRAAQLPPTPHTAGAWVTLMQLLPDDASFVDVGAAGELRGHISRPYCALRALSEDGASAQAWIVVGDYLLAETLNGEAARRRNPNARDNSHDDDVVRVLEVTFTRSSVGLALGQTCGAPGRRNASRASDNSGELTATARVRGAQVNALECFLHAVWADEGSSAAWTGVARCLPPRHRDTLAVRDRAYTRRDVLGKALSLDAANAAAGIALLDELHEGETVRAGDVEWSVPLLRQRFTPPAPATQPGRVWDVHADRPPPSPRRTWTPVELRPGSRQDPAWGSLLDLYLDRNGIERPPRPADSRASTASSASSTTVESEPSLMNFPRRSFRDTLLKRIAVVPPPRVRHAPGFFKARIGAALGGTIQQDDAGGTSSSAGNASTVNALNEVMVSPPRP